jgi:hypothetical protein
MFMLVHLRIGVQWNLVALQTPLMRLPCVPYESTVEDEWSKAARDRAPSRNAGSMWFMLAIGLWH